jgi:hypothetical protein
LRFEFRKSTNEREKGTFGLSSTDQDVRRPVCGLLGREENDPGKREPALVDQAPNSRKATALGCGLPIPDTVGYFSRVRM